MKRLKRLIVVGFILILFVYFGVPFLIGTSWARERIRSAIAEETGRDVTLGSVSFGWFRGLEVRDVRVDQKPGDLADEGPLFELAALDLKVGLGEVLRKHVDIEELTVVGPRIVIVRDEDGNLNFSDLLTKPGTDRESARPPGEAPPITARLTVEGGRILFVDMMQRTRIETEAIEAVVVWEDGRLAIDMTCDLNGGRVRLAASGDLAGSPPTLEVKEFSIAGAEFSSELAQLGHFLPLLGEKPQRATGELQFEIRDLRGVGLDAESLKKSLTASGKISVSGGMLASDPVREVLGSLGRFGVRSLDPLWVEGAEGAVSMDLFRSTFSIRDGKIHSEDMTLEAAGLEFRLAGWTRLDGKIKYKMQIANLAEVLGAEGMLDEVLRGGALPVDLKGSLSDPKVEFDLEDAARERLKKEIGDRVGEGLGGMLEGLSGEKKK